MLLLLLWLIPEIPEHSWNAAGTFPRQHKGMATTPRWDPQCQTSPSPHFWGSDSMGMMSMIPSFPGSVIPAGKLRGSPRVPQPSDVLIQERREASRTLLEQGGGLGGQQGQGCHRLALGHLQGRQLGEVLHAPAAQDGVVDAGAWKTGVGMGTGQQSPWGRDCCSL